MEILCTVLLCVGSVFIGVGVGIFARSNKIMAVFIFIGFLAILTSRVMHGEINKGKPTSLSNLTTGEKYEVVAMYDGKYIVTKTFANKKQDQLRLIGPLNFDTTSVGVGDVCIKTAEGSLEKFLRH